MKPALVPYMWDALKVFHNCMLDWHAAGLGGWVIFCHLSHPDLIQRASTGWVISAYSPTCGLSYVCSMKKTCPSRTQLRAVGTAPPRSWWRLYLEKQRPQSKQIRLVTGDATYRRTIDGVQKIRDGLSCPGDGTTEWRQLCDMHDCSYVWNTVMTDTPNNQQTFNQSTPKQ